MMAELQAVSSAKNLLESGSQYRRLNPSTDRDWALYVAVQPGKGP
jgi:hypothetical protein